MSVGTQEDRFVIQGSLLIEQPDRPLASRITLVMAGLIALGSGLLAAWCLGQRSTGLGVVVLLVELITFSTLTPAWFRAWRRA